MDQKVSQSSWLYPESSWIVFSTCFSCSHHCNFPKAKGKLIHSSYLLRSYSLRQYSQIYLTSVQHLTFSNKPFTSFPRLHFSLLSSVDNGWSGIELPERFIQSPWVNLWNRVCHVTSLSHRSLELNTTLACSTPQPAMSSSRHHHTRPYSGWNRSWMRVPMTSWSLFSIVLYLALLSGLGRDWRYSYWTRQS
jgi:hypothetical protein